MTFYYFGQHTENMEQGVEAAYQLLVKQIKAEGRAVPPKEELAELLQEAYLETYHDTVLGLMGRDD